MERTRVSAGNGRRVQVRKERKDAFTAAKQQVFLDHLAACCNVTRAAAAAGVSVNTVNYHRRTDPLFAQRKHEAMEIAYETLEAAALERAARGAHYLPGPAAADAPGPEAMDFDVALHLLQLRRKPLGQRTGAGGREPKRATEKETDDAICALLDVLDRRTRRDRAEQRKGKQGEGER